MEKDEENCYKKTQSFRRRGSIVDFKEKLGTPLIKIVTRPLHPFLSLLHVLLKMQNRNLLYILHALLPKCSANVNFTLTSIKSVSLIKGGKFLAEMIKFITVLNKWLNKIEKS